MISTCDNCVDNGHQAILAKHETSGARDALRLRAFTMQYTMQFHLVVLMQCQAITTFSELWLGMGGKHVAIPGCGLMILEIRYEHASCGSYGRSPLD
ncbi:hypothetical protein DEO72_LG8g2601 [Vigna unguiculata]|uniref:Uncharacterized protein n=1 Tax=Vigna unguiculata TaxID=3917 RepID=A0A4D6MXF0_VIGUN|nr:hypothetical protein DEO72_LG8g2601 [Vigna unguiculata]